ncbi:hypothetical protein PRK78_002868 [Emydomyces testavorans]|uniref:Uncharacterized protein n=1 Tax=Emydomyces testavorans TaxID=2070801 RepID=A0AAF0II85_9EURO|nr:hypothetical protein PRK78_002868 [Emydomyces testavorans]
MPRTLPWQVNTESLKSKPPISSSSQTLARASRSATDSEKDNASTRAKRPRKHGRSPSTSPVREPPPEEFMREGLENDDLYIMVEDEFLATAHTFTRHLHYAEYVRRKNQAKLANQSFPSSISRPTDGKTKLSNETRKKIEAEEAAARHKAALDGLKKAAGRPLVDSEVEDVDDSEEDRDDDPWIGTQLQPLMVAPRQPRSLVGLHGIKSSTKAALGYSTASTRAQKSGLGKTSAASRLNQGPKEDGISENGDPLDTSAKSRRLPSVPIQTGPPAAPKAATDRVPRLPPVPSYNDTHAIPKATRPSGESRPKSTLETSIASRSPTKPRTAMSRAVTTSTNRSRISKFFDEMDEPTATINIEDDVNEPIFKAKSTHHSSGFDKRRERHEKLRKQRLSEVPTFL